MMIAKDPQLCPNGWGNHCDFESLNTRDQWQLQAERSERHPASDVGAASVSGGSPNSPNPPSATRESVIQPRPPTSPLRRLRPLLDACILGGVTLTPVMSILGWVGLAMPISSGLHQAATALLCVALIWLGFALVAAHALRGEPTSQCAQRSERDARQTSK